jgi:integrase
MAKKSRRAPGAGHLFVRKTTAGQEVWYGKWYAGERQIKRRLGPKRAPGGTKGMARADAERELRKQMDEVAFVAHERLTVGECGARLLRQLEALGRKPATLESYESLLRVHLAPFFAGRSLDAIKPDEIETFIQTKLGAGSSPKTIQNALGLLHAIFELAQRKGWAQGNPCKLVEKPRSIQTEEIRFIEASELAATVAAERRADDHLSPTLALMYLAGGMTGLRQGELIGLRWSDVDWPAAKVRVRRTYRKGEFSAPKSKRASRAVPLADELATDLEHHFQRSSFQQDDDLVFAHPWTGQPLDRTKVRKRFKAALKAGGVREVRFHDLRHTFGTRMAGAGVPMRTLQEWMGHKDLKTTQIYADYAPSAHEREWVEAAFSPNAASPSGDLPQNATA